MLATASLILAVAGGVMVTCPLAACAAVRLLAGRREPSVAALVAWVRDRERAAWTVAAAGSLLLTLAAIVMTSLST